VKPEQASKVMMQTPTRLNYGERVRHSLVEMIRYRSGRGSDPRAAHDGGSKSGRGSAGLAGRAAGDRGARTGGDGGGFERLAG
jgi:hypothetical protein